MLFGKTIQCPAWNKCLLWDSARKSISVHHPIRASVLENLSENRRPWTEFEKWHAIRASVGGVGGVLAWVACMRGWRASVGAVLP